MPANAREQWSNPRNRRRPTGRRDCSGPGAAGDEAALERADAAGPRRAAPAGAPLHGRERAGHTLQPTALVNEAYLRLIDVRQVDWQDRAHFFAMAARLMRRILVDYARGRRGYQKRGGGAQRVSFDEALRRADEAAQDLVALDDALALAALDARKSQVVELRFFGGLSVEETAEALQCRPKP